MNPQLMQAAYRKNAETEDGSLDDLSEIDFNAPPEVREDTPQPKAARTKMPSSTEALMSADEGGMELPDFSGKSMRMSSRHACVWDWIRFWLARVLQFNNHRRPDRKYAGARK